MTNGIWTSIGIEYPVTRDEISAVARKMIELYGKRAHIEAANNCSAALEAEDLDTYDLWLAINSTITSLLHPSFHARSYQPPKLVFTEADVWVAAKQMLELFPDNAITIAAQRAEGAYNDYDTETFNFWTSIKKALEIVKRQKPSDGEAMN
jgi:hypothetical protein